MPQEKLNVSTTGIYSAAVQLRQAASRSGNRIFHIDSHVRIFRLRIHFAPSFTLCSLLCVSRPVGPMSLAVAATSFQLGNCLCHFLFFSNHLYELITASSPSDFLDVLDEQLVASHPSTKTCLPAGHAKNRSDLVDSWEEDDLEVIAGLVRSILKSLVPPFLLVISATVMKSSTVDPLQPHFASFSVACTSSPCSALQLFHRQLTTVNCSSSLLSACSKFLPKLGLFAHLLPEDAVVAPLHFAKAAESSQSGASLLGGGSLAGHPPTVARASLV